MSNLNRNEIDPKFPVKGHSIVSSLDPEADLVTGFGIDIMHKGDKGYIARGLSVILSGSKDTNKYPKKIRIEPKYRKILLQRMIKINRSLPNYLQCSNELKTDKLEKGKLPAKGKAHFYPMQFLTKL